MSPLLIYVVFATLQIVQPKFYIKRHNNNIQNKKDIFKEDQIIFSSNYNITKILVPFDEKYIHTNDMMQSIFFTVSDPKAVGGSCIYVLAGLSAFEILEGGRDSTSDYGEDENVYFGAHNGLYVYDPETLSAKKFGAFKDNIIQLQKANASDTFFILTKDNKIYKLTKRGSYKTKVIACALEFVLDTSDNIYYISCRDKMPYVLLANLTKKISFTDMNGYKDIQLIRPAFVMEKCIPVIADGVLHILNANGTCIKRDFIIDARPSAFSIDTALYLAAAVNGKIYEFNVMEVLLKSMFGLIDQWPKDISKMVISMMETANDSLLNMYV